MPRNYNILTLLNYITLTLLNHHRIIEKTQRCYRGDASKLTDLCRAAVAFESLEVLSPQLNPKLVLNPTPKNLYFKPSAALLSALFESLEVLTRTQTPNP
jgi:hypothetical protein